MIPGRRTTGIARRNASCFAITETQCLGMLNLLSSIRQQSRCSPFTRPTFARNGPFSGAACPISQLQRAPSARRSGPHQPTNAQFGNGIGRHTRGRRRRPSPQPQPAIKADASVYIRWSQAPQARRAALFDSYSCTNYLHKHLLLETDETSGDTMESSGRS